MPVRDGRKGRAALSCPCVEGSSPGSARRSGRRGGKRPHDSEIHATPAGVATGQKLGAETGATPCTAEPAVCVHRYAARVAPVSARDRR